VEVASRVEGMSSLGVWSVFAWFFFFFFLARFFQGGLSATKPSFQGLFRVFASSNYIYFSRLICTNPEDASPTFSLLSFNVHPPRHGELYLLLYTLNSLTH